LSGEILEQSASGFRIEVPLRTNVALNDVIELETWGGTCQALVAYIDDTSKFRRLGLQRVSDEVPTRMRWLKFRWRTVPSARPGNADRPGEPHRRFGLLAASCLCLLLISAAWLTTRSSGDGSVRELAPEPRTAKDAPAAAASPAITAANDLGTTGNPTNVAPSRQSRIAPETVAVLERLAALQTPKTVADLDLTEAQKLQISRLLADITSGLSHLQRRRTTNAAIQRKNVAKLVGKAEARALEILTPQQRARWRPDLSMR
jgi:hypothetical protein